MVNILIRRKKVFCIGRNKTGTTSLNMALKELGYKMGNQPKAELLLDDYVSRDFSKIIRYCRSAEAFQDIPFSLPYTFMFLDQAYPNSKFILSIRDSSEQWYDSLVKFHSGKFGQNGNVPSANDLKKARYREPGFMWKSNRAIYDSPQSDPYNKQILIEHYEQYNQAVVKYFTSKSNLLVINLSNPDSYHRMCAFLGLKPKRDKFPWENKTADL